MGKVEIFALGPFEVLVDGKPVDIGSRLQRRVLAVLTASDGEAITTDRLIAEIWGESSPAKASHSLQTYVSNLRRLLGSDAIESRSGGYRLDLRSADLDVLRFKKALLQPATASADPGARKAELSMAISLWRGTEAYQGMTDDVPLLREAAAGLQELRLSAIEQILDARLRLGEASETIPELQQLAAAHPYREHLTALLMKALYSSGRQADALTAYRELRSRLVEELGIEPSPALQALEIRILDQTETVPERTTTSRDLPEYLSEFIGRDKDLEQLAEKLASNRLVTISGPAGVGKTRLAIEAGNRLRDHFGGEVFFGDLATIDAGDDVAKAVIAGIGLEDQSARAPSEVISRFLASRTALLILDNCEHVASSAGAFARDLIAGNRNLTVLSTSQRSLGLPGETVISLDPLSIEREGRADSDASKLLVALARDADRQFDPRNEDIDTLEEICRRLDGLPLALELAAGRLQTLSPSELLDVLQDRFELLTSPSSSDADRHSTLLKAVEWSYSLLDAHERAMFERVSVLAGSFTLEDAEAVADLNLSPSESIDLVDRLVKRSLLQRRVKDRRSRFRMLETLRAFGHAQLESAGDRDAVEERRALHFAEIAVEESERIKSREHLAAVGRITENLDDMRQAFAWALRTGRVNLAFDLTRPMWRLVFVGARHHIHEGREWRRRLTEATGSATMKAMLYAEQSFADFLTGDQLSATRLAERSLALAEAAGSEQPLALETLACCAATNRETERAIELAEKVIALGGDDHDAHGLEAMAMAKIFGGDPQGAVEAVEMVFYEADARDDPLRHMRALALMGAALQGLDPERSEQILDEAVARTSELGMDWDLAGAVMARALTRLLRGNMAGSLQDLESSIRLTYNVGDNRRLAQTLEILGSVLARLDRGQEAVQLISAAGSLRLNTGVAGSAAEEDRRKEALTQLRGALGNEKFNEASAWGNNASYEEAVELGTSVAGVVLSHMALGGSGPTPS